MGILSKRRYSLPILLFAVICTDMLLLRPGPAASEGLQTTGSANSLSLNDGAADGPAAIGPDNKAGPFSPVLNVRFFGAYDITGAYHRLALIDNQRYWARFSLTRTPPAKPDVFFETDFMNELSEYITGIYANRNLKLSEAMLISVDWGRLGAAYVTPAGLKTTLYYYFSVPRGENISGFEGEVSYPVTDSVRLGVKGRAGLSKDSDQDRDWKSFAFVTYAFGSQKGARPLPHQARTAP